MSEFYSALMLPRHVSDLIGSSSRAFCTSCIRRLWHVVIRVLLDHMPNLRIQLVQNAPDDEPMRSETCRGNISAE